MSFYSVGMTANLIGRSMRTAALAVALALGVPHALAYNLSWNAGTGNFTDPGNVWSYNNGGVEAFTTNPFTFVGVNGLAGEHTIFIGDGNGPANGTTGDVTLNTVDSSYGAGLENLVFGLRVGTGSGSANVPGANDYRGNGILRVTGATPLLAYLSDTSNNDGTFIVGGSTGLTGEVFWDSTSALTVHGALRVGQDGTGTFHQNSGTVKAGVSSAASTAFMAVGNTAGTGTYHLNNGELQIGAALDSATSVEVRRNFRVGSGAGSTGLFNLGDGVGAAGSARIVTWDDVTVGHSGSAGTLNIRSDGRLEINYAALHGGNGGGGADAPLEIQNGAINQQGGSLDSDGILQLGHVGTAAYNITGSTGSINVRALEVGSAGTLSFGFDAAGTTKMTVEGDANTAGDPVKGITLAATSTLSLNNFNSYASNSAVMLIESLDPTVTASGLFGNLAQAQSIGTNSLGTQFYLNYFGGVDGNDIVLQTTLPGSLTTGLVWNVAGSAPFTSGFASSNGNFGVGTFPADPFASGTEELFLGHNGTATLATSGTAGSLQVGTNEAQARIAGRNGNGTLDASGSASLTLTSSGATGDLIVGKGAFTGTVNWGSTGTLEAQGRLRVGEEATGVFNQNDGVVIGGNSATGAFVGVGVGMGGDGTYNLNNGALRPSGGIAGTEFRQTNVGFESGDGELNVGDGVGAAGSAALESNDDLWIGRAGGTGVMNVKADGRIVLQTNTSVVNPNAAELHVGEGTAAAPGHGTVVQTGGTVTSDALVRIGAGPGSVGSYTISGGSLSTATDGSGAFQIARNGATGTVRIEGTGAVTHGAELFIANDQNTGSIGRLELIGSAGSLTIGQLENAVGGENGMSEAIFWQADAGGVIPLIITGAGPAAVDVQLQDPNELSANTGSGDTLMGDGIALELDLASLVGNTSLTLIDNQSVGEPITGFFESGSSMDLYEEGAAISGTGYAGTVNISYIGGDGNDVVLNLVAGAVNSADFDDDGDVDGRDLLAWQRGLGTTSGGTPAQGDANGDGAINGADLDVWRDQFGTGAATPVAAAVPEPAALSLAMAAACLAAAAARRRD